MAVWTKEELETQLQAWKAASIALATSKEYKIGSRTLTRADAKEIRDQINYFSHELSKLNGTFRRTYRAVPRD